MAYLRPEGNWNWAESSKSFHQFFNFGIECSGDFILKKAHIYFMHIFFLEELNILQYKYIIIAKDPIILP